MTITTINFIGPKVLKITPVSTGGNQVSEYHLLLNWGAMGVGRHKIYRKEGKWIWTDNQSPIPVRNFNSLTDLMWEYELPKNLKKDFENLVEHK
jgi:hypothetical protein